MPHQRSPGHAARLPRRLSRRAVLVGGSPGADGHRLQLRSTGRLATGRALRQWLHSASPAAAGLARHPCGAARPGSCAKDNARVDDPYLFERLALVAYGVALRAGPEGVNGRRVDGDIDRPPWTVQVALIFDLPPPASTGERYMPGPPQVYVRSIRGQPGAARSVTTGLARAAPSMSACPPPPGDGTA